MTDRPLIRKTHNAKALVATIFVQQYDFALGLSALELYASPPGAMGQSLRKN